MVQVVSEETLITDYERAVCYYTLPKVVSPVTVGLVAAYVLCVLEAAAALAYGLITDNRTWTIAGLYCFVGIIVFGMIAFTVRAWRNDWHRRVALAVARNAPDAVKDEDIPDPFESHLLVSRQALPETDVFVLATREGDISHYVEIKRRNAHWRVSDKHSTVLFDVLAVHGPGHLRVLADKDHRASIQKRVSLRTTIAEVFLINPGEEKYAVNGGCIYFSDRMVGRIYRLRGRLFLDVEQSHMNDGLLALFVSLG